MIERLTKFSVTECEWLTEFLNSNFNYDFYFTDNNSRIYANDKKSLKTFLKNSESVFVLKEKGDYKGIIMVWKSVGGGKTRHYVKVNAENNKIAKDLLTVLTWNSSRDLFVKLRKDSPFLTAFKQKGFRFAGGRGIQILLRRKYIKPAKKTKNKEEDNYVRHN